MALERFSAAWRANYVADRRPGAMPVEDGSVRLCALAEEPVDESTGVIAKSDLSFVVLNAFPSVDTSDPCRGVTSRSIQELTEAEYEDYFAMLRRAVVASRSPTAPTA